MAEYTANACFEDVVVLEQFDKNDRLVDRREIHNLIPTVGLQWVAQQLGSSSPPTGITHMGFGTGTTAAAAGDTALQTPVGSRAAVTRTYESSPSHRVKCVGEITGIAGAITEEGLFNASTAGTLIARAVFAALNLTTDDTLRVTHYIVPSAS